MTALERITRTVENGNRCYAQGVAAYGRGFPARDVIHTARPDDPESLFESLHRLAGWCDAMKGKVASPDPSPDPREDYE